MRRFVLAAGYGTVVRRNLGSLARHRPAPGATGTATSTASTTLGALLDPPRTAGLATMSNAAPGMKEVLESIAAKMEAAVATAKVQAVPGGSSTKFICFKKRDVALAPPDRLACPQPRGPALALAGRVSTRTAQSVVTVACHCRRGALGSLSTPPSLRTHPSLTRSLARLSRVPGHPCTIGRCATRRRRGRL